MRNPVHLYAIRRSFFLMILAVYFTGCSEPITHNEELAGRRALEFAEVTLVRQDFEKGYAKLSNRSKGYVTMEKFRETISRLHPGGFPTRIKVIGSKPMKDEKAIYIYLSGENSGKQFHYTLILNGTDASDYQVSIIDRTF